MNHKLAGTTFITGNAHKAAYVAAWLGANIEHQAIDLPEIQSLDLHEVVQHKAREAYRLLQKPVLVEDANLCFNAMGRLPGTFIKWFLHELKLDGLCRLLDNYNDRSAVAHICFAWYDGERMRLFDGEMRGTIAQNPRGEGGFGFDPIFINNGYQKTRAEMSEAEYTATSYRKIALDKLKEFMQS